MVTSCCAVGCTNRRTGHSIKKPFYKIPGKKTPFAQRRRVDWINAIKRDDWKNWTYEQISNASVCGDHFIGGVRSDNPDHPNWAPTIFAHTSTRDLEKSDKKKRKHDQYESLTKKRQKITSSSSASKERSSKVCLDFEQASEDLNCEDISYNSNSVSIQCDDTEKEELKQRVKELDLELRARNEEVYKLRQENDDLRLKLKPFGFNLIKESPSLVKFFTGFSVIPKFVWIISRVRGNVQVCHSRLSVEDHVLIVFMKLRLGLLNQDLSNRFGLQASVISDVLNTWLPVISRKMRKLIMWPDNTCIRKNLPRSFEGKFRDAVSTIDCTEVFIERPTNLTARAKTWSNYKHHNTVKYLVGITPAGIVSFLSQGFGGRASDKEITIQSGFLNYISPGDCILADRGFLISKEVHEAGGILKMPSFTKGKKQLSAREVDESRQLARVRIHVERVIGRMKDFRFIQTVVPITLKNLLDDAMIIICATTNINPSIV